MSDLIQAVKGTALSVAEFFTPVLKESKFKKTGVLTPEEFVMAGDHLVHHCPTWSWCSSDNPSSQKSYLPSDKQYLVTKSVPCYKRCKDIEYSSADEKVILTENDEEGWVDTHHSEHVSNVTEIIEELTISDETQKQSTQTSNIDTDGQSEDVKKNNDDDDDDECDEDDAEDMDKYLNMVEDDDKSAAPAKPTIQPTASRESHKAGPGTEVDKDNVMATRTYDLNITYDKYYQTPRLWLVGYDENLKPLTIEQMYQDISQDHANKTVTMETHPHTQSMMASVHPCRHAQVMKKIISTVEDGGKELQVTSYLIIFLKFVQSVIPTIEYDFTQNFTM